MRHNESVVPPGLRIFLLTLTPALKRWAIIGGPDGTNSSATIYLQIRRSHTEHHKTLLAWNFSAFFMLQG